MLPKPQIFTGDSITDEVQNRPPKTKLNSNFEGKVLAFAHGFTIYGQAPSNVDGDGCAQLIRALRRTDESREKASSAVLPCIRMCNRASTRSRDRICQVLVQIEAGVLKPASREEKFKTDLFGEQVVSAWFKCFD
jgi:hypothetical protein